MTDRNVRQRELRNILNVSRYTITRWLKDGTIPPPDNPESRTWRASTLERKGYAVPPVDK